jgi:hypothetical protein
MLQLCIQILMVAMQIRIDFINELPEEVVGVLDSLFFPALLAHQQESLALFLNLHEKYILSIHVRVAEEKHYERDVIDHRALPCPAIHCSVQKNVAGLLDLLLLVEWGDYCQYILAA